MQYSIEGDSLPVVICALESGERMMTESGGMSWMSPNMKMETSSGGGIGKMFGRMLSGESLFVNYYTAVGGPGMISFASSLPGAIRAFNISPGNEMICQKSSFLAATDGVELSMHFQKKIGSGLFGGEGFIMQKLSGTGTAFVELDGSVKEYNLQAGQQMVVGTGHLAAMTASCSISVVTVPGIKNMFLGGEGFFNTVITGPGTIYLQSMPIMSIAGALSPFITPKSN